MYVLVRRQGTGKFCKQMDSSVGSLDLSEISEPSEYACPNCKYTTANKSNYNKHIKSHQPRTSTPSKDMMLHCDQCSNVYKTKLGLRLHILNIHEKNFKYNCQVCEKGFNQRPNFRSHCSKHTGFGMVQCKQCKKNFTTSYALKRHMGICKKNPDPADQEQYKCDICDSSFSRRSSLAYHMKGKHESPKYVCDRCGLKYAWRSSLKAHIRFSH